MADSHFDELKRKLQRIEVHRRYPARITMLSAAVDHVLGWDSG